MKVIKADEVLDQPQTEQPQSETPAIDKAKVAELQEKFDTMRQIIETKKYGIALNADQTNFLINEFYQNVEWKGYESYAIAETFDKLNALVKDGELNGSTNVEIIEAIFHFLKNYVGKGVQFATTFKQICDQFAVPMKEINEDRQSLRDLSLELVSAEQGIPVEDLVEQLNRQQALQNGRQ